MLQEKSSIQPFPKTGKFYMSIAKGHVAKIARFGRDDKAGRNNG